MAEQLAMTGAGEPAVAPAPEAATLPRTWDELFPRRAKPEGVEYGFLSARGEPVGSSYQTLAHLVRTGTAPPLVWTPDTPGMVPPWEVPQLLDIMREPIVSAARRELRIVRGVLGVFLLLALLLFLASPMAGVLLGVPIGVMLGLLVASVARRVKAGEQLGAEHFRRGFDAVVDQHTEAAQPIPATRAVAWAIAAVGVCQIVLLDTSVEAGAVSRDAVAAGEWWRLFTAPMLHGGLLHFWMNYGALESLGRTMETRGARGYVPLVFLAAALAGGVFSILLPPESQSVGASGGLMGMFGFLAVMAWRREKHLPEGFLRGLLINVALIGLVGVIAYRFIDNAAHAGGLIAGLLIGMISIPRGDAEWVEAPGLGRAAWVAQGAIYLSAALTIALTLLAALG